MRTSPAAATAAVHHHRITATALGNAWRNRPTTQNRMVEPRLTRLLSQSCGRSAAQPWEAQKGGRLMSKTEAFWCSFLRSLVKRGLTGVQLVVSDAHAGLKKAIGQVLGSPGSAAASTSCARRSGTCAKTSKERSQRRCRPIFNAETGEVARRSSATRSSGSQSRCRWSRRSSKRPKTTCSPCTPFPPTTRNAVQTSASLAAALAVLA
jgi:Transposase, Mutator family